MSLFTIDEINYFHSVHKNTYRKGVAEHEQMWYRLRDGIWESTKQWADAIRNKLPGFVVEFGKHWQKAGYDEGQAAVVKPYTWARILRPRDKGRGIYFTIGVDAGRRSLITKIDYQQAARQESVLDRRKKRICQSVIYKPDDTYSYCEEIPLEDVEQYSLDQLTARTIDFVREYESIYDWIVGLAWPELATNTATDLPSAPQANSIEPAIPPVQTALTGRPYLRREQLVEPVLLHRLVSDQLAAWLRAVPQPGRIQTEWPTLHKMRVDLVREYENTLTFYEIKAYACVRTCIREAVGQLLDYAYWPGHRAATQLVIITPSPADESTRDYMHTLRTTLKLPIWYQQFDLLKNQLGVMV